jgi:DNA-binding Xre family transcriptional regulator
LLLNLGNELCDQLGWQPGDTIKWIDNHDGTFTLRKINNKEN